MRAAPQRQDTTVPLVDGAADLIRERVIRGGEEQSLSTRETELLAYLWRRAGEVVSRDELLTEVWHYKATRPTRAVDLCVRRLRKKIEPDPSEPVLILSVFGEGYRFAPPAASPGLAPVDGQPAAEPTNLAPGRDRLLGRDDELARVEAWVDDGVRLITVVGPGGVGKTRLARHLGWALRERFEGGSWFCDLSEAHDGDAVVEAVARVMGVPLVGGGHQGGAVQQVGYALAQRGPMLVIVDNLEQVLRGAASALSPWLDAVPEAVFLATSRERLGLRGEHLLELEPLGAGDAEALFRDRVRASGGDEDALQDTEALRQIIDRVDGLPLAIELAAPRVRTLSLRALAARLEDRLQVLEVLSVGVNPRHTTMRAALDASWELLSQWEQELLGRLAVFRGGFDLDAVESVCASDEPGAPWVLDVLQGLRDKSLVQADPGDDRYRLLDVVRAYAQERLDEAGDAPGLEARHAAWYGRVGERWAKGTRGPAVGERLADLERERANLVAALHRARAPEVVGQLVGALLPLLRARGPLSLQREVLDVGVEGTRGQGPLHASMLAERAYLHLERGDTAAAGDDLDRALALAPADEAPGERARVLLERGDLRLFTGGSDGALEDWQRSEQLYVAAGDPLGEARALGSQADALLDAGRVDEAEERAIRALQKLVAHGNTWSEAVMLAATSRIALVRGHVDEAVARAERAETLFEGLHDWPRLASVLIHYSAANAELAGRFDEAAAKLEQAVGVARRIGGLRDEILALVERASLLVETGDVERAAAIVADLEARVVGPVAAMAVYGRGPVYPSLVRLLRAILHREAGNGAEAIAAARDALSLAREVGSPAAKAWFGVHVVLLLLATGRSDEAREVATEAVRVLRGRGQDDLRAVASGVLAVARARAGDGEGARAALQEARALSDHPLVAVLQPLWRALVQGEPDLPAPPEPVGAGQILGATFTRCDVSRWARWARALR